MASLIYTQRGREKNICRIQLHIGRVVNVLNTLWRDWFKPFYLLTELSVMVRACEFRNSVFQGWHRKLPLWLFNKCAKIVVSAISGLISESITAMVTKRQRLEIMQIFSLSGYFVVALNLAKEPLQRPCTQVETFIWERYLSSNRGCHVYNLGPEIGPSC